MTSHTIRPVILCGGNGKRLWPVSRKSMPKQFARIGSDMTMLQETIQRFEDAGCAAPLLMTGEDYRFTVAAQVEEMSVEDHKIVIEPDVRNTGPAICAAAEILYKEDPDALMLVTPADHRMANSLEFASAVAKAADKARDGEIVTFGIRPTQPETGYGYIQLENASNGDDAQPYRRFVEKPDLETAQEMVESGEFLWNSGIFMFSVATIREAFTKKAPEIRGAVRRALREAQSDLDFLRLGGSFNTAPDVAFDYAVMEKSAGWVVPLEARWSDLGSWRSVWEETGRDENGLATSGSARGFDCEDTLLFSGSDGIEVVGVGLKNIAAVATQDAVLIADLDNTQAVSQVVTTLKAEKVKQAEEFARHARPWGHYETLSLGDRFQVKSIVVKPDGKLSLQSHVHRAEHWVVVEGTATVTIGEDRKLVGENQSVYIPLGEVHRLENTGKVPLQLIEVQTGAYLGEDDIVRYEDVYERA